jgi:hypothetical protein
VQVDVRDQPAFAAQGFTITPGAVPQG